MAGRYLGIMAILGVAYFVAAGVALHFLDSALDPAVVFMSDYALGPYGWLMRSAFVALGFGILACGLGLQSTLTRGKRVTPAVVLVIVAGVGILAAGAFNTDPYNAVEGTTLGTLHAVGSLLAFLSLIISAWLLRGVFSRDARWQGFSTATLGFAIAMTATFIFMSASVVGAGLGQRIFVVAIMSWLALLAWQVYQRTSARAQELARD